MNRDVFEPGDRCGSHEIVKRIAEGGHGQVYLARHNEGGFRAIKTLHAQFLDIPNVRQRFDNEILLLSAIDSVHVVRVFEYGLSNGHPWFAMEYLDGQPLRRVVLDAGGRLDVERAFRFGRQLARGAHTAHQLKAIHRDLKPENIVVMPGDVLKILDFGIAKIRGWAVPTTGRGEGFCTPLYAAPEQIDGSGRRADARTDVYAIGVILWEVLVGKNPFLDEDGNQPAMEITLGVKLTRPLRRLPDVLRAFPEDLAAIIEKATAIDPDDRYASAAELAAAIKDPLKRWVARTRGDALPELPKEMAALTAAVRTGEPPPRSVPPVVPAAPVDVRAPAPAAAPMASSQSAAAEPAAPPTVAGPSTTAGWARTEPLSPSFRSSWLPAKAAASAPADPETRFQKKALVAAPTVPLPAFASSSSGRYSATPPAVTTGPRSTFVDAVRVQLRERTILAAVVGSLFGAGLCVAIAVPLLRSQSADVRAAATTLDAGADADASVVAPVTAATDAGSSGTDGGAATELDAGADSGAPTPNSGASDGGTGDAGSPGSSAPKPSPVKTTAPRPSPKATAPSTPPKKKSDRPSDGPSGRPSGRPTLLF